MKATPILFLLFSIFFFLRHAHSQTPDSCNSHLNLQTPLPFDTSFLRCVSAWGAQNFVLRYAQSAPNVWSFVLSAPNTNAYIGMGFSPNGNMVGSRAMVGWAAADGTTTMSKYFLGGQTPDRVRRETSNDQGLQIGNQSIVLQSNTIYMAFQVITDNPGSRLIYSVGPAGRLPGPNFQLSEHRDMVSTTINLATGQFQTQGSREASLRRSHGLLNMFGWAILMPIGAMVARYMRNWDPIWFYSHAMIQSLGFLLGLSGVICGLVLEKRLSASVSRHKGLGIFVLVLGCLQVMAGLARPDKASKFRRYWNWYHFTVGRVLIFIAAVNVFYGIHLGDAGSSWNAGFAVVLVIFFIITLILELRMWFKK